MHKSNVTSGQAGNDLGPSMDSSDEAGWYRAATLAERAAAAQCTEAVANDPGVDYRLREWKSQPPFTDPSYFAQRLAVYDLTEAQLTDLLGEPAEALRHRLADRLPWFERLRTALESADGHEISVLLPNRLKNKPTVAFLTPAGCIVGQAVDDLVTRAAALVKRFPHAPFESAALPRLLFPDLAEVLLDMLTPAMVLEMNVARLEGSLEGETAEARFRSFVARFHERERVRAFLREFPVLARVLLEQAHRWVDASLELLERLCTDWTAIQSAFAPESNGGLGMLTGAAGGLADPHCGGRSVVILRFTSGSRLVYKPKPLAVDVHFQDLLRWLNARGNEPPFRTMTILDRDSYGWAEYIEATECRTGDEVRRFYQRQGAYVAVLYLLDGTDFHSGNLIACGEHPVLVDLEALFHSQKVDPEPTERTADRIVRQTISKSVLCTDLLPERVWSNSENEGVDISGLGTPEGQVTPHPLRQWEAAGTDSMHLVRKRKPISTRNNRPKLDGAAVNPLDYRQAVLDGFAAAYSILLANRDELLSEKGPLFPFRDDEVRAFLRSSRTYRHLLRESYHPDLLHDSLDRERLFDKLWAEVERRPELLRVIEAENDDLLRGDLPTFTTRPDSRDLWTSQRKRLPDFFSGTSFSVVRHRVESLGDDDFARQMWFVQASMATLASEPAEQRRPRVLLPFPNPQSERFLAAARAAGDRLSALAVRGDTDATWIGLDVERDRAWSIAPAGLDLYAGVPGIALFVAYLSRVTGDARYKALARAALVTMRRQIEKRRSSLTRIGAFDGWGGVLYVLSHLVVLWNRPELLAEAESLVDALPPMIDSDDWLDVENGASGCIFALRSLYQVAPADRLTALAVQCGDRLLAGGKANAFGESARPPGFARGAAGIAAALASLHAWTGLKRFRAGALAAWTCEWSLTAAGTPACSIGWCRGAPGIGLARIASREIVDEAELGREIRTALETTVRGGFGWNHSLGYGDLGNLEFLLQANRTLGLPASEHQIAQLADSVLTSLETDGRICATPFGIETPGLMAGVAGIGYGCLRLARPNQVPSVLLLEPPYPPHSHVASRFVVAADGALEIHG